MEELWMKVRIEIDDSVNEEEVIIRCRNMNEAVLRIQAAVMEQNETGHSMLLKQGGKDYYLPVEDILFFETERKTVYAHTRENILETEYKLYELEELLPGFFMRISKSALLILIIFILLHGIWLPPVLWNLPTAINKCMCPEVIIKRW